MNSLFTRISIVIAFISVSFGVNAQAISSNLNNRPGVTVGVEENFLTTYTGVTATSVKLKITLSNPAQAPNINLSLLALGSYTALAFDANGISESQAAPPSFFPSPLQLKVTFAAAGVYGYSIQIIDDNTSLPIATSNESVTVVTPFVAPTLTNALNGETLLTGEQFQYGVTTTAGSEAGTLIKVFLKVNPAQVANTTIEYFEVQTSTWMPFPINANGTAVFGPNTGFPLANATTQFRVTYNAPGVYNYKLSLFRVASPNDTLVSNLGSVTVTDPELPTISSSLNGQTILTDAQTPYAITTVANDFAGTPVKVFFKAANVAQVPNYDVEYFETTNSTWIPLTLTANGELDFGPNTGFPLANAATQFRVTFDTPGVYGYKLSLYEVASHDTLATATESVTVVDYIAPTILSSLNGLTVNEDVATSFTVTTTTGSIQDTLVKVQIKLLNALQTNDVNLSYEATPGTFLPITFNASGIATFGPATGFPLAAASTNFKATFDAPGVYHYKLSLYKVSNGDTVAASSETVTVNAVIPPFEAAEISSDLDERANVVVNGEEAFTITTVQNDAPNGNVRIKITLDNPLQADSVSLLFNNPLSSSFEELSFDTNGVTYAGATTGFALGDEDYDFKVTFLGGGLYKYNVALIKVSNDSTIAENDEQVYILDNSSIKENAAFITNAYPNPTTGIVSIQTKGTGVGSISVYTLTGKKVINQTINGSTNTLSLESLTAGLYIVKVSQNGNDAVIRVVKK